MTPASAARRLERINAQRDLLARTDLGAGIIDELFGPQAAGRPALQFVGEQRGQAPSNKGDKLPPREEPAPSIGPTPPPATSPAPQPAPQPPQPLPAPQPAPQAGPAPAADPAPDAQPPAVPDPFGLPDTTGKVEGDEWDTVLPDGRIVHNRIPVGNGNQTVNQTIPDGKGGATQSRVAAGENGGWQRWNLNADGTAFYGNKPSADSGMLGQDYGANTPTTGRPDHAYVTTPDYKGIQNPSYDENGILVGTDIAVPNEFGLYDNYHYDLYNNLTISRAMADGKGGILSTFIGQLDSNNEGWVLDKEGRRWEVGKDLLGRTTRGRTEFTGEGTHVYYVDHRGVLFDSFYGNAENQAYTDIHNIDDTVTRRFRDGTQITVNPDLSVKEYKGPRDRRDIVQKGVDGLVGVGRELKSWGADFAQTFNYGAGLRAAVDPTNPANRAAAAQQSARSAAAMEALGNVAIDAVVYPVETVGRWLSHTYGGAFYGMTADPITPTGRARLQAAQEYSDQAPSTAEALFAATTFIVPEFGGAARVGAAAARATAAETAAVAGRQILASGVSVARAEAVPLSTRWLTTAELPRNWTAPFTANPLENAALGASTTAPRGIVKLDTIRSGSRTLTAADLTMMSPGSFPTKAFDRNQFSGIVLGIRSPRGLPAELGGRTPVGTELASGVSTFDPRRLGVDTYPLSRSTSTNDIVRTVRDRELVTAGRSSGVTAAEHQVDVVLQTQPGRVVNSAADSGSSARRAHGADQPASGPMGSTGGSDRAPRSGGNSGGGRPPRDRGPSGTHPSFERGELGDLAGRPGFRFPDLLKEVDRALDDLPAFKATDGYLLAGGRRVENPHATGSDKALISSGSKSDPPAPEIAEIIGRSPLRRAMLGNARAGWSHDVEMKAAVMLNRSGETHGMIIINNPAGPCLGCLRSLEYVLDEGKFLTVAWPGKYRVFRGNEWKR